MKKGDYKVYQALRSYAYQMSIRKEFDWSVRLKKKTKGINQQGSYSNIQDRYDFAIQSFEQKRKWLDDLSSILSERADIEATYSKSLLKLANSFEKYSNKNSLEKGLVGLINGVKSVILTQSEQAMAQSESIKSDVVAPLKIGVKRQADELQALKLKVGFLKLELNRNLVELEKQKQEYYRNYKMFARSREYAVGLQLQEANLVGSVLQENENLLTASQLILGESIQFYNTFLESYFDEITHANTLNDRMEEARVDLIKDALLKSLVFQISAIKNVEYDTNQVAKKIETYQRIDAKPFFYEQLNDRMMLSKLNYNNYLNYVHSECALPQVDRAIQKPDISTSINLTAEINKSLKKFLDVFGPKKPSSQIVQGNAQAPNDTTLSGYYYSMLNDIFFNQQYLNGVSINSFKEQIESNEKERILFGIALHNFSHTTQTVTYTQASEKAIGDLIFLINYIFTRCESLRESGLIERCYVNFSKICKNFLKENGRVETYMHSLRQHTVLKSSEFWAQDVIQRISQAETRSVVGTRNTFLESQIRLEIARWKNLEFSKPFQFEIFNVIADATKIESEKRIFYSNVIAEKEKFQKKPIFSASGMPSQKMPGYSQLGGGVAGAAQRINNNNNNNSNASEGVQSADASGGFVRNDKILGEIGDVVDEYELNSTIQDFKAIQPLPVLQGKASNVISSIGKEDAI